MRIAMVLDTPSRGSLYNGTIIRESVGAAGSETDKILVAEEMARHGHEVHYISHSVLPGEDRGVLYMTQPPAGVKYDYLFDNHTISTLNHDPIPARHAVVMMNAMVIPRHVEWAIYGLHRATGYRKLSFIVPSVWSKATFHFHYRQFTMFPTHVIGNVIDRFTQARDYLARAPHFLFNSSFERGGAQFNAIFDRLPIPGKTKTVCSYHRDDKLPSLGKNALYQEMEKSDYCLFPLVLPDGMVHKDTFNMAAMEAMSRGAICVAPRIEPLACVYHDHMLWVDLPTGFSPDVNNPGAFAVDPTFLSEEYQENFVRAIMRLERDPDRKAALRRNGVAFAQTHHTVAARYPEYLKAFPDLATPVPASSP